MSLARQFQISRSLRSAIASSSRPAPRSVHIHPLPTRPSDSIRSLHIQKGLAPPISPIASRSSRTSNALRLASTFTSSGSSGPGGGSSSSSSFRSQMLKPTSILLVFVPIVCGFLGVWQVKRLRWKVALIDEVDRNLHKDPLVLPANIKYALYPSWTGPARSHIMWEREMCMTPGTWCTVKHGPRGGRS